MNPGGREEEGGGRWKEEGGERREGGEREGKEFHPGHPTHP